jgi:hypothetical protein
MSNKEAVVNRKKKLTRNFESYVQTVRKLKLPPNHSEQTKNLYDSIQLFLDHEQVLQTALHFYKKHEIVQYFTPQLIGMITSELGVKE